MHQTCKYIKTNYKLHECHCRRNLNIHRFYTCNLPVKLQRKTTVNAVTNCNPFLTSIVAKSNKLKNKDHWKNFTVFQTQSRNHE